MPPSGQGSKPPTPPPSLSIKGAVGQLKTDTGKTTDDVKALDVNKAQQDAGQVKQDVPGLKDDVRGLEESAKGILSNPFGQ